MDLTLLAIPGFFGTMGAEHLWLEKQREERGPSAADYEWRDTLVSLGMGQASLFAPYVVRRFLGPFRPEGGKHRKLIVGVAVGSAVAVTIADVVARRLSEGGLPEAGVVPDEVPTTDGGNRRRRRKLSRLVEKVRTVTGASAVAAGGVALAAAWAQKSAGSRLYEKRLLGDRGTGPLAVLGATLGWDLIYYWNHRLAHESRYLWSMHVVHHSSERYNLSTALRQPVADALVMSLPYGALALLGYRPSVIETARGINLLYQYWIHTEVIPQLPRFEKVFNSPSLHRVHHGSNRRYLDRNHGSILIVWDRLFGTHEPEGEPVVYGLTRNIDTFDPLRVATHEFSDMLGDSARSTNWSDRLGFVLRGPGWAYRRREELEAAAEDRIGDGDVAAGDRSGPTPIEATASVA